MASTKGSNEESLLFHTVVYVQGKAILEQMERMPARVLLPEEMANILGQLQLSHKLINSW
ncbi:hypothetical protein NC651_031136 [Populus alba x Populus x berolinensis]|nr:hypothetical protein NC651_031136 [Populus alba x Populus x berolinensis]